jgi:copper transport protein
MSVGRVIVMGLIMISAAAAACFADTRTVDAHANLVKSIPPENAVLASAPAEIQLVFSEEPELSETEVSVLDPAGNHVENNDLHKHANDTLGLTVPDLPDGTYTVVWKTVSAVDGHLTRGTFAFGINAAPVTSRSLGSAGSAPPRWLSAGNRWLTYASMFLLIGGAVFIVAVMRPVLRTNRAMPGDLFDDGGRAAVPILVLGTTGLVVSTLLTVVLQVWTASGSHAFVALFGADLVDLIRDTRFGHIWIARAVITLLAALTAGAVIFRRRRAPTLDSLTLELVLLAIVLAVPMTVSLNSHAAADRSWSKVATGIDWLHLVVGGVWIGGVVQFAAVMPVLLRKLSAEERSRVLGATIPRFSLIAIASVAVLVATGLFQWWIIVGDIHGTLHSAYGQTIIAKVVLLVPLLSLGAANLLIVGPRLKRLGTASAGAVRSNLVSSFRLTVTAEVLIGFGILVASALLTSGSPPFSASSALSAARDAGAIVQRQSAGDIDITTSVAPGTAGPNVIDFFLKDAPSEDTPIQRFIVRFTYLDEALGTTESDAAEMHPTHYELTTSQFSLAGRWKMEVVVRRFHLDDVRTSFELQIQPGGAMAPTAAARPPEPTPPPGAEELTITASNSTSFDQSHLEAHAGSVSIEFVNDDANVAHNFHLFRGDGPSGESIGGTELARGPGDRQRLNLNLEAGIYYFQCDVHPDMRGTLTVASP